MKPKLKHGGNEESEEKKANNRNHRDRKPNPLRMVSQVGCSVWLIAKCQLLIAHI